MERTHGTVIHRDLKGGQSYPPHSANPKTRLIVVTEADRQTGYAASGVLNTIKELNQQSEVIRTGVAELLDNAIAI